MSDSDSDADFESADEDTGHDTSNKSSYSKPDLNVNKNQTLTQSLESNLLIKSDDQVSCPKEEKDLKSPELASESSLKIDEKQCKQVEDTKTSDIPAKEASNINELNERSRVTLRLEKKAQERNQQISKESTIEKEHTPVDDSSGDSPGNAGKSSWGFGSWGTSILSTAATSVSTFTNQVSHGIESVLETVESTLGTPSPEEMARIISREAKADNENTTDNNVDESKNTTENENENTAELETDDNKTSGNSILSGVSSWTKVFENTSTKVLMGGLDTLELIGKKTIDMLTEGDPGLRKKRAVFTENNTLSQMLREAKTKADEQSKLESENEDETIHYSQRFDEYQGLVHLEALEILSAQCQAQVQSLTPRISDQDDLLELMDEIRIICQNVPPLDDTPDEEKQQNFDAVFLQHIHALELPINTDKLMESQRRISEYIFQCGEKSQSQMLPPEEVHREAINSLAEFTAKCIEQFHKIAELILVQPRKEPSAISSAGYLTGLTTVLCVEICIVSSRFNMCLEAASHKNEHASASSLITSVYLEASNSTTYIQDAYQLFIPVLQLCLLESVL